MLLSRALSRASRSVLRSTSLLSSSPEQYRPILSERFRGGRYDSPNKFIPALYHLTLKSSGLQWSGISSSTSPEPAEKEREDTVEDDKPKSEATKENGDEAEHTSAEPQTVKSRRRGAKRVAFSDSDSEDEGDLSMDKLAKLVAEKEELLKLKHKEIEKMQDKVLRSYAEMENVMDRTRREAENSKKYAIQSFAKGLLDVADNLERASSVVKDSFAKIDASKHAEGAVPLLKTLLEGVAMTEKQLMEAFKKFGIERYDPTNEPFDPHRHNAVFQMPGGSKPPGTVAAVLKAGYMLYDRVLRPAEVGVTTEAKNDASENSEA